MNRNIIVNSSVAFVIASIVQMTLHETSHFMASLIMGYPAVLHHNYVRHLGEPEQARLLSAAAGPLTSLVLGICFQYLLHKRLYKGLPALVAMYMSMFGYIGFLGYVMIAPFFSHGDIGFIMRAIGCPSWLMLVLVALSAWAALVIFKTFAAPIAGMTSKRVADNSGLRRKFVYSLIFIPLFIGIALTVPLNLPAPTPLSLIAPLTSPFIILWPFRYYLKATTRHHDESELLAQCISAKWVILLIVVVAVNRLLVQGLTMLV